MSEYFTITIGFTTSPSPTVTASPESVEVDYGVQGIVNLDLQTDAKGAMFAAQPVVWDKGAPQGTVVTRLDNEHARITENDEDDVTTAYSFRAQVSYQGRIYQSPDPVLINKGQPPG